MVVEGVFLMFVRGVRYLSRAMIANEEGTFVLPVITIGRMEDPEIMKLVVQTIIM